MKPLHAALIAVVALLVGGGIGFAIGHQPAIKSAPTPVNAPDLAAANTPSNPQPDPPRVDPPRTESPRADTTASPGLADWIASLGHIGPEPGTGRFHGRATLPDGKPLAGVTVTAQAIAPRSMSTANDATAAEQIEAYALRTLFAQHAKYTATTDADGRYEIAGLGKYSFGVSAERAGFRLSSARRGSSGWLEPDAEVNFTAEAVCELVLDVRLPDGSQPAEANYSVWHGESTSGGLWRPQFPRIVVMAGEGSIQFSCGKHNQFRSDAVPFDAKSGTPTELTVQLQATLGIAVGVELPASESGKESGSMHAIYLQPNPPAEPPGALAHSLGEREWASEYSVALFSDVKPGRYRVLAVKGRMIVAWQDITLGSEFLELTLKVPEPVAEDHVIIRVTGPSGEPLSGVSISVNIISTESHSGRGADSIEKGEGVYWVRRLTPDDRDATGDWRYSFDLRSQDHGSRSIEYPRDATHELHVQFQEPSSLTVTVAGLSTHPKKELLRVQLWQELNNRGGWSGMQPDGTSRTTTHESDVIKFTKLSQGKYRFQLSLSREDDSGFRSDEVQLAEVQFDVAAGANAVTCTIPEFFTLTINVPDPKKVGSLSLAPAADSAGRRRRYADSKELPKVVYEGVTAGEWRVFTRDGEMRVRVSADTEVTLSLSAYDCVVISDLNAGGKLEALGLRNGDKLIRVDGLEWDTLRMFQTQVQGSMGRDETTWTVIRNGAEVDVKFRGKDLMKIMDKTDNPEREKLQMQPGLRD